jgi:uncharacterized repeat protein (TIGR01451 family)
MTITLTNPDSGRAITGAQIVDSYPAGMINVDDANPTALFSNTCGGTATADANGVSASLADGVVPAGSSCSIVVNVVGGSTATNNTGPVTSNNAQAGSSASATLTVAAGALLDAPSVAMSFTPDHVVAGDIVATSILAITLTNQNPYDITGVSFTDNYPQPLHMANAPSGTILANTCGGALIAAPNATTVALTGGTIPANDFCVVKIQVYGTSPGSSDNHTGAVTGDNANVGADAGATLTVTDGAAVPDLTLTKTHAADFAQGQTAATYTLIATNIGGAPSSGPVSVTDMLPPALVATDMEGSGWTCDLQTTSCVRSDPLDVLDPGTSYPAITLTVNVAWNAPSAVTNTAAVSGGSETDTSNDGAADPTTIASASPGPDLTMTKSHLDDFVRGQTGAVYSLIAHNVGAASTSGSIVVTDALPGALIATDMGGPGWACDLQTTSCTRSDPLPAGQSYPAITLWVDVASNAPAIVLNTATVGGGGESNTNNDDASDSTTVVASPGATAQAITFTSTAPAGAQVAGPSYVASATATSGLPVMLTIDGSSATVCAIENGTVTFIGAGTCAINANQGGDAIYAPAAEVQQSFAVASAGGIMSQTITFTSTAPSSAAVAGPAYAASAIASSNLPVVLTIDGSSATVCSIANDIVTFIGAGICTIDANQGGDTSYAAAPQTQQSFAVTSAGGATSQTITFTSLAPVDATVAGTTYHASAAASSGLPVVLTIDAVSDTVCMIDDGWVSFIGAGPCVIDANQGGNMNYAAAPQVQQAFDVAFAAGISPQMITFISSAPIDAVVGGPTYLALATASSGLPVVLTIDGAADTICTINDGTVSFIGAGTCTINANQAGNDAFAAAPQVQQAFAVTSAGGILPQTIAFTSTAPSDAEVAGTPYHPTAIADSGLSVTLTIDGSSAAVCTIDNATVSFIGAGTCTIDANQGGNADYAPAPQMQQSFAVASAGGLMPQTITFTSAAPADAAVNGPSYLPTATATSGLPVVLTIDGASATVCTIDNGTVSFIGAGICTIDAHQGGDQVYAPAPEVQQSFPVAPAGGLTPQTITFTSIAPSDAVVGGPAHVVTAIATSGLSVVLTIDPASGTVCAINSGIVTFIGPGICTIDANQGGDEFYAPAPEVQQSFPVAPAGGLIPQTITYTSTPPISATVDGAAYFVTATASSGLQVGLTIDGVSASVCVIDAGTVSFIGVGTCTIDANQGGDAVYLPAPQVQQTFSVGMPAGEVIFRDGFENP